MLHELLKGLGLLAVLSSASADDLKIAAQRGQSSGQALLRSAQLPGFVDGGEREQGSVIVGDESIPVNQFLPGGDRVKQEQFRALEGDQDGLDRAAQSRYIDQAADPSDAAEALRDVTASRRPSPDRFLNDEPVLFQQAVQALTRPHSVAPDIPACQADTHVVDGTTTYTTYRERTCERIHRPDSCTRQMQLVDLSDSDLMVMERDIRFERDERIIVSLADSLPPGSLILSAALTVDWHGQAGNVLLTEAPSHDNGWKATVSVSHAPDVCTECTVRFSLHGPVRALHQAIDSNPPDCLLASDGFCTARFTCHDSTPRSIGGRPLRGSDAPGLLSLYPTHPQHLPPDALAPVCYQASAEYDCPIRSGAFCLDTPTGQQCSNHHDGDGVDDSCAPMLAAYPECSLIHRACTEGAQGHDQWCYVESLTYRCPERVPGPNVSVHTTQPCSGQIRCAGNDCLDHRFDESSFESVSDGMAGMMVAQAFAADWQSSAIRSTATPAAPSRLFPGQAYECRKALGGAIDCCDETRTNVEQEWFESYQRHSRRANARDALARYADGGRYGSWKAFAESRSWNLDLLSSPLTSGPETITAGTEAGLEPEAGSIVGTTRLLQPMNDEFIQTSRYDHMGEVGWACSAHEFDLANQRELGHCLNIGSYCRRNLLGACLDKRDVFCCFNSAASKLVRESLVGAEGDLSQWFGTAQAPRCEGIVTEALSTMTALDITDLKGRLARADVIPSAQELLARASPDRLTGTGSNLADGFRPTAQRRTQQRMDQIPGHAVRDALFEEGQQSIPTLHARGSAGHLSFSPAFMLATAGRSLEVSVSREGQSGAVGVQVVAAAGQDWPDGMPTIRIPLHWQDGEHGRKSFFLTIPAQMTGDLSLQLVSLTGGAIAYPNELATIRIRTR